MNRISSIAAVAASMLAFTPAAGAQTAGYYVATPASAPGKTSLVTRSTVWKCTESSCVASRAPVRDFIMCEVIARQVGTLTAFSVAGTPFDADALAKCNSKAK